MYKEGYVGIDLGGDCAMVLFRNNEYTVGTQLHVNFKKLTKLQVMETLQEWLRENESLWKLSKAIGVEQSDSSRSRYNVQMSRTMAFMEGVTLSFFATLEYPVYYCRPNIFRKAVGCPCPTGKNNHYQRKKLSKEWGQLNMFKECADPPEVYFNERFHDVADAGMIAKYLYHKYK